MKKKILNKKIIYGYVRCEKKTCVNKYKPLKVPKILIGKQKCQVCKNIMKKKILSKLMLSISYMINQNQK